MMTMALPMSPVEGESPSNQQLARASPDKDQTAKQCQIPRPSGLLRSNAPVADQIQAAIASHVDARVRSQLQVSCLCGTIGLHFGMSVLCCAGKTFFEQYNTTAKPAGSYWLGQTATLQREGAPRTFGLQGCCCPTQTDAAC